MSKTGFRFNKGQLSFLRNLKKKTAKASSSALKESGEGMIGIVRRNASYPAFSRSELADKGHPYAKRRGTIGNTGSRPKFAVGKDTGKFLSSIQGQTTNQYEYRIFYKESDHVQRLVVGTQIMIGRDVVAETAKHSFSKWVKSISSSLKKRFK